MKRIHAILLIVIFALCGPAAAQSQTDITMKDRLVELVQKERFEIKGVKRKDAAFCRKMLADLKAGKNFENPRPVATGGAALRHLKCKPARRLDEGSGNFTGYEYEMNENVDDGPEYVFVSEGAPGTDTWIKTVNEGTCVYFYPVVSGGGFSEWEEESVASFSGLINYRNMPYIVHGRDHFLRVARFHADTKERLTKAPAARYSGANCVFRAADK